jgi:hypothetical protein
MTRFTSNTGTAARGSFISGPARDQGYIALEGLGRLLLYGPIIGLLFTSLWSVGLSLLTVVMPLTWLTFGGQVPVWMRANPEKLID